MSRLAVVFLLGWVLLAGCERPAATVADSVAAAGGRVDLPVQASRSAQAGHPAHTGSSARVSAADDGEIVALVNGRAITAAELTRPLIEGYGLRILNQLLLLHLAEGAAKKAGIRVSEQDVKAEHDSALRRLGPDLSDSERMQVLRHLLNQRGMSMAEYRIGIRRNAILRKLVGPKVKPTTRQLREEFDAVYGLKVQVGDIEVSNLRTFMKAKRRIEAGEDFAAVAGELSENAETAVRGGLLEPFSRSDPRYPEVFRQVAFALKVGELSEPVQCGGKYHLLKLVKRIPPKAVKFEDVQDFLRQRVRQRLLQAEMARQMRLLYKQAEIEILNPVLKAQYELQQRRNQSQQSE